MTNQRHQLRWCVKGLFNIMYIVLIKYSKSFLIYSSTLNNCTLSTFYFTLLMMTIHETAYRSVEKVSQLTFQRN